jgi:redox-sensitive bicupin YhaK (pirin superfamily)
MDAGAEWTLPGASDDGSNRVLYFFSGPSLTLGDHRQESHAALAVRSEADVPLRAGPGPVELLLLQGRPIGEPVAQHGPFVMNTRSEIQRAIQDYQRTRFGGWPWPKDDPVHERAEGRFARHADGRIERG